MVGFNPCNVFTFFFLVFYYLFLLLVLYLLFITIYLFNVFYFYASINIYFIYYSLLIYCAWFVIIYLLFTFITEGRGVCLYCQEFATSTRKLQRPHKVYIYLFSIKFWIDLMISVWPIVYLFGCQNAILSVRPSIHIMSAVSILLALKLKLTTSEILEDFTRRLSLKMGQISLGTRLPYPVNWKHMCFTNRMENWITHKQQSIGLRVHLQSTFCGRLCGTCTNLGTMTTPIKYSCVWNFNFFFNTFIMLV